MSFGDILTTFWCFSDSVSDGEIRFDYATLGADKSKFASFGDKMASFGDKIAKILSETITNQTGNQQNCQKCHN